MTRIARNRGYTLVELVIVIAILAILASVVSPLLLRKLEDSKTSVDIQKLATIRLGVLVAIQDKEDEELPLGKAMNMAALDDTLRTEISTYTGINFDLSLSKIFKSKAAKSAEAIYMYIAEDTRNVTVWLGGLDGIPAASGFDDKFYADGDMEVANNSSSSVKIPKAYTYVELMAMTDEEIANLPYEVRKATDLATGIRIYEAAKKVIESDEMAAKAFYNSGQNTPLRTTDSAFNVPYDMYTLARTNGAQGWHDVEKGQFITNGNASTGHVQFREAFNEELGMKEGTYKNNKENGMKMVPITTKDTEVYRWFVVRRASDNRLEVWVGNHGTKWANNPVYRVYPEPDERFVNQK
ncbi:MAG: type II secretion system GspH family protein [Eubacterium sp.]|nr:type II secretion system GspH family protein [Eubacterium sp.]